MWLSPGRRTPSFRAYCEMGIAVRAYAMANLDVKRAACVGCGMCAHVCPRGPLKLEVKPWFKGGTPIRVRCGSPGRSGEPRVSGPQAVHWKLKKHAKSRRPARVHVVKEERVRAAAGR